MSTGGAALSVPARQLTPQADEREFAVRGKSLIVMSTLLFALALSAAPAALAADGVGGVAYDDPAALPAPGPVDPATQPTVPGEVATIVDGLAAAPASAPDSVKQAIWAANAIIGRPYRYGGGHAKGFSDRGYDCSGTVSFALHGGDLLDSPLDSGSFMRWGESGEGQWITVYTNPGHAYAVIAGLRLDTSAAGDPSGAKGPRWRPALRSSRGFKARHPIGL
jgi:cell wall-associated NlpC family hydrolase